MMIQALRTLSDGGNVGGGGRGARAPYRWLARRATLLKILLTYEQVAGAEIIHKMYFGLAVLYV
jgi:hypothetical protein